MKIAVDLRSLSSGAISGVENYCLNVVGNLLKKDNKNEYLLFYNSFSKKKSGNFHYVNSRTVNPGYPNKLLNLAFKFKAMGIERLAGDFDWWFMPNLSPFHLTSKAKVAITVHDLSPVVTPQFYDIKRRFWHQFLNYKQAFSRANLLFTVSEHTKKDLVTLFGVDDKKIKVIYPAVDHTTFNPNVSEAVQRRVRNSYGLPGDFYLFLSTIEPRKNLAGLVRAFELAKTPAHLVVAGRQGWKCRKTMQLLNTGKKRNKIKYIGYIKEADKPALYKLSRALVYPSFYEGFGFQPLEAMATGTPVVASNVTSLPEVTNGAALLINPYNPADLISALEAVQLDKELREALVLKGLSQAAKFSWSKSAEEILTSLNSYQNV